MDEKNPYDYKLIVSMIKDMEESYESLKKSTYESLRSYSLKETVLESVLPYKKEDIPNMDINLIMDILKENCTSSDKTYIESLNECGEDLLRDIFTNVKNESLLLISTKMDLDKLKSESSEILSEYLNYSTSKTATKLKETQLNTLKTQYESEPDSPAKSKIKSMIEIMESAFSLSFIDKELKEYGENGIDSIKDGFFEENKGRYILSKFDRKIGKFGYKPNVYKSFFNIEETFLPEEYAPFNDLFLFYYIRFVSKADPYIKRDFMYVQAMTSGMANLVYHKFNSEESEKKFIDVIKNFLSYFLEYSDEFKEKNSAYKNHPYRIEMEEKRESNRKSKLIESLKRIKVDFDETLSADDLQEIYNKVTKELIEEQIDKNEPTCDEELTTGELTTKELTTEE